MTSRNERRDSETPEPDRAAEEALIGEVVSTALVPRAQSLVQLDIERQTLNSVVQYGRLMAASGMFSDIRSAAQAAVKILAGREIGLSPMQSMTEFHVIKGKITASAHLMAAKIKESDRYDYEIVQHDDIVCIIDFFGKNREDKWVKLGQSAFSMDDAANAGLLNREGRMWEKFTRNMLFSRAMSNGCGWYCPDVFTTRVYTPDELSEDISLDQYGNVQDVERIAVAPGRDESEQPREQQQQRPQQQRPAPRPPEPRGQQAPEQINTGVFGNPGAVAKRAREELNLMPSEIEKRLGSRLSEWAGREEEAWRILSGGASEPVEAQDDRAENDSAIPYPWGPALLEACEQWSLSPEVVLAVLSGQPVASAEPWDSIYSRLDAVIKNPPREAGGNPTVALLVEYAAAAMDDDSSADTPPTDSPATEEPEAAGGLLATALAIGATRAEEEEPSADTPST